MKVPDATRISPVWLRVGTLLDGVAALALHDVHVVYDAQHVRFVGQDGGTPPRDVLRDDQQAPDLHLPNATLLPGLIEGHAHLFLEGGELDVTTRTEALTRTPEELQLSALERLDKLVRLGVTAVRDAGDKDGVGLALSRLYRSEARPLMPYVDSPGAAIHREGRYGSFMGEPAERHPSLADCVAARVADGADRIKIIATGIINFRKVGGDGGSADEHRRHPADSRGRRGATGGRSSPTRRATTGIEHVIEGGVHSVEHGFFVRDDQLARMRDRQIAWVPTFAPVRPDRPCRPARMGRRRRRRPRGASSRSTRRACSRRTRWACPSSPAATPDPDGVPHGLGLVKELELMEGAGLPPVAVLNAATGDERRRISRSVSRWDASRRDAPAASS